MALQRRVVAFRRGDVEHTLKMSGDGLEELVGDCTPMFIYRERGREWVRWAIPAGLMPGVQDLICPDCGRGPLANPDGGVYMDTAYDDVARWVRGVGR